MIRLKNKKRSFAVFSVLARTLPAAFAISAIFLFCGNASADTLDTIMAGANYVQGTRITGATINLAGILGDGTYAATSTKGFAVWDKTLTYFNPTGPGTQDPYPGTVTARFALNSDGYFYVGAIGPAQDSLAAMVGRNVKGQPGYYAIRSATNTLYTGAGVILYTMYDIAKTNGYITGGPTTAIAFGTQMTGFENNYAKPMQWFRSGTWCWDPGTYAPLGDLQTFNDLWCPTANGGNGAQYREFQVTYTGSLYSAYSSHVSSDNTESAYVNWDGATHVSQAAAGTKEFRDYGTSPVTLRLGGTKTWSQIQSTFFGAVVADNVSFATWTETPGTGTTVNPQPFLNTFAVGWSGTDLVQPEVTNNQTGDATWRTSDPGAIYDVDFSDTGGSGLNNVQYTAYTGAGMTATQTIAWTDIATSIFSATYTTNWAVNFAGLAYGTNYISVRAYDVTGNISAFATDVFYVNKYVSSAPRTYTGWENWYSDDVNSSSFSAASPVAPATDTAKFISTMTYSVSSHALTGDVNGDGKEEMILYATSNIYVVTETGLNLWTANVAADTGVAGGTIPYMFLTDTTGDGFPEVFVSVTGGSEGSNGPIKYAVYDGTGGSLLKTFTLPNASRSVWGAVGDIDADGVLELVTEVDAGFPGTPRTVVVYNYNTTSLEWSYNTGARPLNIAICNIDSDPMKEILVGLYAPHNGQSANGLSDVNSYVLAFEHDGALKWSRQIGSDAAGVICPDLDNDGNDEVVAIRYQQSYSGNNDIDILDKTTGNILNTFTAGSNVPIYAAAGDVTGSTNKEIVVASANGTVTLLNTALTNIGQYSAFATGSQYIVPAINDIDKDGKNEIILTRGGTGKVAVLNSSMSEKWSATLPFAMNGAQTVSNFLTGGSNEILVPTTGGVVVLTADMIAPTVTDNQADISSFSMSDPGAIYDVDFYDAGGAGLKTAQYSVWSGPGADSGTGTMILNWTNIATGINSATYTANWNLNFASLSGGINYVSVRAFDNSSNLSAVATDVFYMKKYAIFTDSGQALGSYNTRSIAPADTNNDGLVDFFEGNNGQASRMWMNNGSGVFTDSGQTMGTFNTMAICSVDVNRDTYPDYIQGNYSNQVNRVWTGSGGIMYDSGQSLGSNYSTGLFAGDFDNDGAPDFALSKNSGQFTELWKNDGAGTFSAAGQTLGGTDANDVKGADLNGDGFLDLVVSHGIPGGLPSEVWMNNGDGTFTNSQSFGNSFSERIALTDIDGDGDMDLAMAVTNTAPKGNKVWRNNGSGVFTDTGQSLGNSDTNDIAAGDVDNDGDMDLIECVNPGQTSGIWLNNGTGSFTDSGVPLGAAACASVALADVDGDYDLDVIEGVYGAANKIWINNALTANTPPPAPAFIARADAWTVLGATRTVKLDWTPPGAGDDHTPNALLSYDVRIGTTPSGCEILCSGGLGVGPGNAGATTSLLINLASGTYYWSLRTVDSAYARSAWSAEDTFNVSPDVTPPSVTDNQANDTTWRSSDPGAVYDVDFSDSFAGLKIAQYSVWSAPGESAGTGSQIIGWATIAFNIGAATYTTNWGVNFASLSEGLNYVSVRAADNAANVSAVSTDAFYISKDTQPPAGGYVSYSGAYFTTLSVPVNFATGTDYSGVATWSLDRRSAVLNVGQCGAYGSWGMIATAPAGPIFNDTSVSAGNCYQYRFNNADALGFATSTCTDGAACAAPANAKVSTTAGALSCSTYGDLSQNGQINIVDAAIMKQKYGITGSLPCLDGDLNADNAINLLDVNQLKNNYLASVPPGTPETALTSSVAALTLTPSPAFITYGVPVTVNVVLNTGAAQIDGADIHLSFATSVLSLVSAAAAPPSGFTQMIATGSAAAGTVDISLFNPTGLLTSFNGSVASITFNVLASATTTISFVKSGAANRYTAVLDNGDYKNVTTTNLTLYYDQTPPVITDNQAGDDTWRKTNPGAIFNVDFSDAGGSNLNSALYTAYTGPGMTGTQSLSWTSIASGINASSYTTDWGVNFASLTNGINYITVRAFDYAGNPSAFATDAFYVKKDTAAPVFSGLQSATTKGGRCGSVDLSWNAAADAEGNGPVAYNIYMAASAGAENFTASASYQTASTTITITGLTDGVARYFVVRAADALGNMDSDTTEKAVTPADAVPPTVADNQAGDDTWYSADPGAIFDVDFTDPTCDALSYAKYAAYGGPGMSAQIGSWATIAQNINSASYTANWGVNFFALPDGINYIAVYATKSNGPVSTATEVFYIKKDVTAPSAPGAVNDGSGSDAAFATDSAQLSANWSASADPNSGVSAYWYSIGATAGASDTTPWTSAATATSVTKTGLSLVNGQTYYFTVKAMNAAGLFSAETSSNGARAALITPVSAIINPKASSTINTLSAITGTAADNSGSGLLYTQVSIIRTTDRNYWNGAGWQPGAAWLTSSGAASWILTSPLPAWQNGVSYQIQSKSTDNAAHVETPGAGVTFTFDTAPPAVAITSPAEGAKLNASAINVSGTVESGSSVTVNGAAASVTGAAFTAAFTPANGSNVITAIATDAAGNAAQISVTVSVDMTMPAALIMTPANSASVSGTVSVTGTAADANFASYVLEYGPGSSPSAWKPFASGTIPVSAAALGSADMSNFEGVYKIRLTVNDSFGNTSTTENQITVAGNKLQRNIALNPNEWTIVGMPLNPDSTTLADILDATKYKMYWWNPAAPDDPVTGKYQKPSTVIPGQAVWMKSIDKPMSLKLTGAPVNSGANYEYPLVKGWNQIATPFNWPVSWQNVKVKKGGTTYTKDEAVALSLIESTPFDHNVAGWKQLSSSSDAQMHPGYGYFIYVPSDGVSLVYSPGAEDPRGVARIVRVEPEFSMNLSARTAAVADEDNIISMTSGASDKYDSADLREPPGGMDKYISLYFPHTDWTQEAGRYANDARGSAGIDPGCAAPSNSRACKNFNFNIDTNDRGTVTLTWTSPAALADKYTVTLYDLTAAASVDMAAQSDYQYPGGNRSFKVTVVRKGLPLQSLKRSLKAGWNLVSIPLETQTTNAVQQLGSGLPSLNIYQYFDNSFTTPSSSGGVDLQNGIAYWIYTPEQTEIDIEGSPADTSAPVLTPLKPGWNLIGDPYAEPIVWGDNVSLICGAEKMSLSAAAAAGRIYGSLYKPAADGSYERLDQGGTLQPWDGYLLKSQRACSLEFRK